MTQADTWCPYGSQEQNPFPLACSTTIDLASAAAIAAIFPVGIPAEIASLVSGVAWGTIVGSVLCSMPPADPGPFPVVSLLTQLVTGEPDVLAWIAASLERYWWQACCQCTPPPPSTGKVIASWQFSNFSGGYLYAQPVNPNYGLNTVQWISGRITNDGAAGTGWWDIQCGYHTLLSSGACPFNLAFDGVADQLGFGPGAPGTLPAHGAYGSTLTSPIKETISSTAECVGIRLTKQGTTTNTVSGEITLYAQVTDTTTLPASAYPPPYQPTGPSGGGSGSPTYGPPTEGIVPCNFGRASAKEMELTLAPLDEEALSTVAISGTGNLHAPTGAYGYQIVLSLPLQPYVDEDAGVPPLIYHAGWIAPSEDGTVVAGPQHQLTAVEQTWWDLSATRRYVVFNLFPGTHGTLTWLGAAAPV